MTRRLYPVGTSIEIRVIDRRHNIQSGRQRSIAVVAVISVIALDGMTSTRPRPFATALTAAA